MAYSCLLNGLRLGTSWFKPNIVYEGRVSLGLTLELTLPFTTLGDGGSSVQKKIWEHTITLNLQRERLNPVGRGLQLGGCVTI